MTVDDAITPSPARSRSTDPLHTVITEPAVDLRARHPQPPEVPDIPEDADLATLRAELARLAKRVAALESETTAGYSDPSRTRHQVAPVRRRTRASGQTGWQPTKR